MSDIEVTSGSLPGLYQSADNASIRAQQSYFSGLRLYLVLLVLAALTTHAIPSDAWGALLSAALFLITLGILIFLRVKRPDDTWYNGRAVAESVKTRTWRWMMRAEPYEDCPSLERISREFVGDLKAILEQNHSLSHSLHCPKGKAVEEPISATMRLVRALPLEKRLAVYVQQRVQNQANWYWKKSSFNQRRARQWFWVSVGLHALAIAMLLYRIKDPHVALPIEVVATAAGSVLTWLQAKKHNELSSAYALAAHEIVLLKGEAPSVRSERELSEYVVNSESAFSREHTQWVARKGD